MDKKRREKLREVFTILGTCENIVNMVLDKEMDCISNYPENLQSTDRFEKMEDAVDNMEEALDKLSDAKDYILAAANA